MGVKKKKGLPIELVSGPCPYLSGTEEKIQWMIARVEYDIPLHHPGDVKTPIHPHDKNRNIRYQVTNREIIPDPEDDEDDEDEELDDI